MLDSNLPVFISVAESGSFSQAALRLAKVHRPFLNKLRLMKKNSELNYLIEARPVCD